MGERSCISKVLGKGLFSGCCPPCGRTAGARQAGVGDRQDCACPWERNCINLVNVLDHFIDTVFLQIAQNQESNELLSGGVGVGVGSVKGEIKKI